MKWIQCTVSRDQKEIRISIKMDVPIVATIVVGTLTAVLIYIW